jgi:hypothetical protein
MWLIWRATRASGLVRVLGMALAQIGPLTTLSEAAATAVGAGVVLGSVAAGVSGLFASKTRRAIEKRALHGGYVGGIGGAALAVIDAVFAMVA